MCSDQSQTDSERSDVICRWSWCVSVKRGDLWAKEAGELYFLQLLIVNTLWVTGIQATLLEDCCYLMKLW